MVDAIKSQYLLSCRLLRVLSYLLVCGILAQALGSLAAYLFMLDAQAAGMIAHLLMENLSYYLLGCAFVVLSISNILIKRGLPQLRAVRLPSLILIICVAVVSFLLIPRMDYLRETALQNGMPVMLSPFANYFVILNSLTFLLLCLQIFSSFVLVWRLSETQSN